MKNLNFILLAAIVVLILLNLKQCQSNGDLKNQKDLYSSNLDALRDTVRIEKNKAGQIEFSKQALISQNGDLEKLNKKLAEEVKNAKGKVIYVQSASGTIDNTPTDPQIITNTVKIYDRSTSVISTSVDTTFDDNNYRKLSLETTVKTDSGKIISSTSQVKKDEISFNIITGLKEEKGKLRIFIRSDYPGLSFSKIDGSLVDPQKSETLKKMFPPKRFGAGLMIGYGLTQNMTPGFFIGAGIQYNLIRW